MSSLLVALVYHIDTTAADLCQNLRYDTGSMTRMSDRLENLGLIRREQSNEDRRGVRLSQSDREGSGDRSTPDQRGRTLPETATQSAEPLLER
ncbi:MarR family transcriptional regulator [Rhabdochromatium marinum]|uniref:MarR family transcriptional regulator n=1 Tax=Rhabdochromatium marinum TaxID=48729 RepID=UPI0019071C62